MNVITEFRRIFSGSWLTKVLAAALLLMTISPAAMAQDGPEQEERMETGNDPRDFNSKFMPYFRYTELENGLEQTEFTFFGFWAVTKNMAITAEIPWLERDITGTDACAGLPDTPCTGEIPGGGATLPNGLPAEGDGKETGQGDSIIRFIADPGWNLFGGVFFPGAQLELPTANDDVLGSETISLGPIMTHVWNVPWWPAPGSFFAMMNIYTRDVVKDSGRGDVNRFMGRWFLQLPISQKYRLYTMTEFQPIYDFEESHFSFWFGPEFGKAYPPSKGIFRSGGAIYIKPGLGIDPDSDEGDRDWSIELGFRFFWPVAKDAYDMMSQVAMR